MIDKWKLILEELVTFCKKRLADGKGVPENIIPLNIATMVQDQIKVLAFKEERVRLEKEALDRFGDMFKPILHINRLPDTVTA
jgi:hypothetical protein